MTKVIKIIDEYNILIDTGSDQGLRSDSTLEIYEIGEEIIVDGVNYGTLDNVKATLEVKTLYPKMALCQSNKVIKESRFGLLNTTIDKVAPLSVEKSEDTENLSYLEDKTIAVGDLVRKK